MPSKENYQENWNGFLSDKAYQADSDKFGKDAFKEGKTFKFKGRYYRAIYTKDDKSNGFQDVAVAPTVSGNRDDKRLNYNDVQIATAVTNPDDIKDIVTDGTEITESRALGGKDKKYYNVKYTLL
ncbi:hypothetical protein B808_854 [Fructilactobacillus florum 8D]|uniref:Uncharacterized protein n=1 Tax=Fructilactobacillus florum 8D TaxID=1221538 RepID=W9EGU3_9LACO|nr:hypothetical protein [Fructilactobacillus florum]EKK20635.1 hypothetical protein B807_605 [Fructilactobacillus florum 2F]ETO40235.1 hypothetical protein B808_854 [Fructilactobacillus florum 8D]